MSDVIVIPQSAPATQPLPDVLQTILASRTFEKAPALRNLLEYLWRNRHFPVSEYAIATDALGRGPGFESRTDATVRVQIGRLRQRLERFYETEGRSSCERLTIPLGSHQLQVLHVTALSVAMSPEVLPALAPVPPEPPRRWSVYFWPMLSLALLVLCGVQARQLRSSLQKSSPAAPWFWESFFKNKLPTRVVLPTPVFFSFDISNRHDGHAIMFRDTEVNEYSAPPQSALFRTFVDQAGKPVLADNYTVTSDTFASVQIARYLDAIGIHTAVNSAAEAPMEALDDENVIAVGTWGTLTPLKPYLDSLDFRLSAHETSVQIANPLPGEPSHIDSYQESGRRGVWPGVVAFLPGMNGRTRLLVLGGRHTSSLVSLLTSTVGLNQLRKMWIDKGSPEFFQAIVNAELNGEKLLRVWPVALHPYKGKA